MNGKEDPVWHICAKNDRFLPDHCVLTTATASLMKLMLSDRKKVTDHGVQ